MKRVLAILFILILITGFVIWNNQKRISKEEKTINALKNVTEKIQGAWKSNEKIAKDNEGNNIYRYIIFYDGKVRYTGYVGAPEYDVEMLSTTNMYFGMQNWSYKYFKNDTLVHNGNLYHRINNVKVEDFENGNIYTK